MNYKEDGFKHDLFLGGPPDHRCHEPYRATIKDALRRKLNIYDWEKYKGDDYQKKNHEALADSSMMIAMVPDFPFPMVAEEVGYFYANHDYRIEQLRRGLYQNHRLIRFGGGPPTKKELSFKQKISPPINPIILIWPKDVDPKTQKSYRQIADIVTTAEEAIALIRKNLHYIKIYKEVFHSQIEVHKGYRELRRLIDREFRLHNKDMFFELIMNDPEEMHTYVRGLVEKIAGKKSTDEGIPLEDINLSPDDIAKGVIDLMGNKKQALVDKTPPIHPGAKKFRRDQNQ